MQKNSMASLQVIVGISSGRLIDKLLKLLVGRKRGSSKFVSFFVGSPWGKGQTFDPNCNGPRATRVYSTATMLRLLFSKQFHVTQG